MTGADVVVTITKAESPVFDGALIEPGVHINAAGSNRARVREIDPETIRRADLIVIDSRSQGRSEAGDGRTSDAQITLFESLGIAAEDVAVARVVYEGALERGAGVELPPYPGLQLHALPEQRP